MMDSKKASAGVNDGKTVDAARSALMRRVRQKDTAPEIAVRKTLHNVGFRFRLHRRDLPGSPDIVLPRHRKVIFVHGCFWHGHEGCPRAALPKTRSEFWSDKIGRNKARDANAEARLKDLGWEVLVVWQCQTKPATELRKRVLRFMRP